MLKSRQDLIEYRRIAKEAYELQTEKVIVCGGTGCVAGGSLKVFDRLRELRAALEAVNVETLTPIEAMNVLYRLRQML